MIWLQLWLISDTGVAARSAESRMSTPPSKVSLARTSNILSSMSNPRPPIMACVRGPCSTLLHTQAEPSELAGKIVEVAIWIFTVCTSSLSFWNYPPMHGLLPASICEAFMSVCRLVTEASTLLTRSSTATPRCSDGGPPATTMLAGVQKVACPCLLAMNPPWRQTSGPSLPSSGLAKPHCP